MEIKIGSAIDIYNPEWEENYRSFLDAGFAHFEIYPANLQAYTSESVKQFCSHNHVLLHAPTVGVNLISPDREAGEVSEKNLAAVYEQFMGIFNIDLITTHIGLTNSPNIRQVSLARLQYLYSQFPQICVENLAPKKVNGSDTVYPFCPEQLDFVLENIKNIGLTFDIGHWGVQGKYNVYALLEKYLPRVRNIHVHDFKNGYDHLKLGMGDLDLEKLAKLLIKNKYDRYLTLEVEGETNEQTVSWTLESYKKLDHYL